MAQGSQSARQTLIEHNLRLVAHIIKKYYANQNDQEDLISIGTIGLIKAIDSFDAGKGIRLSSYASKCIENEILMFFPQREKDRAGRLYQRAHRHRQRRKCLTILDTMATDDTIIENIDIKMKSERLYGFIQHALTPRERGNYTSALWPLRTQTSPPEGGHKTFRHLPKLCIPYRKKALEKLKDEFDAGEKISVRK